MTSKEMIATLKLMQAQVEWDYPMEYAVAIDGAIEALEKQIPKETILKPAGLLGNIVTYSKHCPECDHEIFAEKYCSHCGQKIYWWED